MRPTADLDAIYADLEVLSRYARAQIDEFGSVYASFEGGYGGNTVLLWTPRSLATAALRAIPDSFSGRVVLGLDASPGDALPFGRALELSGAELVVILGQKELLAHAGGGWKELAGDDAPLRSDCRAEGEALLVERTAPTGLVYLEKRAYPAWSSPALDGSEPGSSAPQGSVASERGLRVYSSGPQALKRALSLLLK